MAPAHGGSGPTAQPESTGAVGASGSDDPSSLREAWPGFMWETMASLVLSEKDWLAKNEDTVHLPRLIPRLLLALTPETTLLGPLPVAGTAGEEVAAHLLCHQAHNSQGGEVWTVRYRELSEGDGDVPGQGRLRQWNLRHRTGQGRWCCTAETHHDALSLLCCFACRCPKRCSSRGGG